jgi:hypothetical protein
MFCLWSSSTRLAWEGTVPFAHGIVDIKNPHKHRQEILCRACYENPAIEDLVFHKVCPHAAEVIYGGEKSIEEMREISDALQASDKSIKH